MKSSETMWPMIILKITKKPSSAFYLSTIYLFLEITYQCKTRACQKKNSYHLLYHEMYHETIVCVQCVQMYWEHLRKSYCRQYNLFALF